MKKYRITGMLCVLLAIQAQAQFSNLGGYVKITPGSSIKALDGVANANGGTLTVDGTLSTPADLANTSGATLQGNGQYHIGGNWTNDAAFDAGTSTVAFEGAQNSTVTSGGDTFYKIHLNKTGGNDLVLADNMEVSNTLDFQAADNYVVLGDFNLQAGDILGYEASRYVRTTGAGFLLRTVGATPVDFPVGNTSYNPAVLTNAGTPDVYLLRVADAVLSGGATGSPITVDVVGRGWFVEENIAGGSDLSLTLQWNGSEEQATFDRTNAYVSHYLAGSWDSQPAAAAGGADPYQLSRSGITVLSPFAVFDGDFTALIDISGLILWEHDGSSGVKDVSVALTGDDTDSDLTPAAGTYTLTASNGSSFTITPTKYINKLNGITVADATAIQQHVTFVNPITSPYKQVAADVNKSNSITTFDATVINQSLLGNPAALNQFKISWRFVPASYTLPLPPWGFPEKINLTGVSSNVPGQDFWGIKTGDVVDTYANPANLVPNPPLVLRSKDQNLEAGQELTVMFQADAFEDLAAWQFALRFDPERLQLATIEPLNSWPLTADNFGTYRLNEGEIRSVWTQAEGIPIEEASSVFQLKFKVLQDGGWLSEALYLDKEALSALAYTSDLQESPINLVYAAPLTATQNPAAAPGTDMQVFPNPFSSVLNIRYELSEKEELTIEMYEMNGRRVAQLMQGMRDAGVHQLTWEGVAQGLSEGLYLLHLQTRDTVLMQKVNYMAR